MVNTWSVKDRDINYAVSQIRWPRWTDVQLTIERFNKTWDREILEKTVTRDKLTIPSVTHKILTWKNNSKIWYINLSIIWEETEKIFKNTIYELKQQNINWVIIDLRWNWWWLLPIAVEISSHFIPRWQTIVTAKYKIYNDEVYKSKWYWELENIPTIVLVDGMTASAWEIIALALQEQIWAKIIWTQTFGKGSIQTIDEFSDQDSIKYTIWKRYTPSWNNIDNKWITPDIIVEFKKEDYIDNQIDNQLDKAQEELNKLIN